MFARRYISSSIDDLLGGVWAIDPSHLERAASDLLGRVRALTPSGVLELLDREDQDAEQYAIASIENGIGRLEIRGLILRESAAWARLSGACCVGLDEISHGLDWLTRSGARQIELAIDSPGGTAVGVTELVARMRASEIPIVASVDGAACSAAYWIACGAREISATPSSLLGSVGVYSRVEDSSRAYETMGVRVIVVRSASAKGQGEPGTEISAADLAPLARYVADLGVLFSADVRTARAIDPDPVSTGEAWIASRALELGLIDRVTSVSSTLGVSVPIELDSTALGGSTVTDDEKTALLDRIEQLEKRIADLEGQNQALQVDALATQRSSAIDAAVRDGRVPPPMRAALEAVAKHMSASELETVLSQLTPTCRAAPVSIASTGPDLDSEMDARVERLFARSRRPLAQRLTGED
jgi:ClpP class serine protease